MAIGLVVVDVMYLICLVVAQEQVIKEFYDFMRGSSLLSVTTLTGLVAIGIMVVEIYFWFITWCPVNTCSMSCVILCVEASHCKSPLQVKFGVVELSLLCASKDIKDLIFHLTLQDHLIKGIHERKLLIVYPHPARFGSHRHCGNGYIMILAYHVILQDNVIVWSCHFKGRNRSW